MKNVLMISGIGQFHTNEPDPKNPNKELKPYLAIDWVAMQRYKRIFGNTLRRRGRCRSKKRKHGLVFALNRMTGLGMPVPIKI